MAAVSMAVPTRLHLRALQDDHGQTAFVVWLQDHRQHSALCIAVQRTWVAGKEGGHRRTVMGGAQCGGQEQGGVLVRVVGALKHQRGTRCQAVPFQCQV